MNHAYQPLYAAHVSEIAARWSEALEAEGYGAALVHSGTPLVAFLDDYEYAFRPNPHFLHWLPLTHHHDSVLLFVPGERPRLFFFQPDDYWYLPPSDPEGWWASEFDIETLREPGAWRRSVEAGLKQVGLSMGDIAAVGDSPSLEDVVPAGRLNPKALVDRIHLARTRKTPYEQACMEAAAHRAAHAHRAAEQAFREGESEFGIHLRYLAACGQNDAVLPYNNIVALNRHGAVLHYQGRDREAPEQVHSFLIDAGATVNAYASDFTRTYAREPGLFADLVDGMDELQLGLVAGVKAGIDYRDLHLRAHRDIADLLRRFGVIRIDAEDAVATGLSAVFYPHGLGHFLGLQTHDVAGLIGNDRKPIPRPEGHPALRLTRVLEAGNVLTIEPGLYFIDSLQRRWRDQGDASAVDWDRVEALAPCGGIRIEDNVVVTGEGCENLTRKAFAALD